MLTWTDQQLIIGKIERRYIPLLTRRINAIYREGLELYRQGKESELSNKFFDAELFEIVTAIHGRSGVVMARYVYKSMPTVRQLKAGQMGISARWLSAVKTALNRFALQFVTDIVGTLRQDMTDLFKQATEEGWSYEKLAYELLKKGLALRRSRVIARTEAHRGAMQGSVEGANTLPYEVEKEWLSATDVRVRRNPKSVFDHRELNGQRRDMGQPFKNEEEIMQPGDPKASAGNTIQCRCVLNYVPKRDERGMLILK